MINSRLGKLLHLFEHLRIVVFLRFRLLIHFVLAVTIIELRVIILSLLVGVNEPILSLPDPYGFLHQLF